MSGSRQHDPTAAVRKLQSLLGERLTTAETARREHGHDASHHAAHAPDAVAFPVSTAEVAQIVGICAGHRTPVIPYGTGTAVEGGVVAVRGGVCVDLSRMNRILAVHAADADATVEAGVTRNALNRHLEELGTGLHFPVDPGADASLGGMAATCASGSAAVRYGTMRENVLRLTVVLPDGRVIRTGGRARKSSAGYDLTRLFVGSEGTLGIITEATLRLARLPAAVASAICSFPTIDEAVAAAIDVMTAGIAVARIELLDEMLIDAVKRYKAEESGGFLQSLDSAPTLFFEFHGSQTAVVEQANAVGGIVRRHSGGGFHRATDKSERDRLWQARYDAYYAALALREGGAGCVTDVCVPVTELAGCIARTKSLIAGTKVPCPILGHVGDGNYHVVFVIDPQDPAELAEVQDYSRRIVADALAVGGTCTGEHGIGLGKLDALREEHGGAVDLMRAIKQALDPLNIMNPGKVICW